MMEKRLDKPLIAMIILLIIILWFIAWRVNIISEKATIKKQVKLGELATIKSDIQNIYTKMILIHEEIGDHEVRIHKLEPESPTIKLYLKNIEALKDVINIHRRELKKWQKTQEHSFK